MRQVERLHVERRGDVLMVDRDWIVCGWFTPDYAHYALFMRTRLEAIGAPHDFRVVEKQPGGWRRNTLEKPAQLRDAMKRHIDKKVIIFLDVDCRVWGTLKDLDALAETYEADISFYLRTGLRSNGKGRLNPRSGTIVIRQTPDAMRLVDLWIVESINPPRRSNDQDTLMAVLGRVPGLTIAALDVRYCAVEADGRPDAVIQHWRASATAQSFLEKCITFFAG
jgi:hypothetical protein